MLKLCATIVAPALFAGLALSSAASAAPVASSVSVAAPDSAFVQVKSKGKAKVRRHHGPPSPVTNDRQ